jgi:hypothetical protein
VHIYFSAGVLFGVFSNILGGTVNFVAPGSRIDAAVTPLVVALRSSFVLRSRMRKPSFSEVDYLPEQPEPRQSRRYEGITIIGLEIQKVTRLRRDKGYD